jgi:hypothetical protein
MCEMPNTMTAPTTRSLIATITWFSRLDSLIPAISTAITSREMITAGRSTTPSAADPREAGTSRNVPSKTSWK